MNTSFDATNTVIIQENGCANGGIINTYSCNDDVTYNTYSRNGNDGTNGTDGFTTLTTNSTELSGANCSNAGTRVDLGVDTNRDNILDISEITNTSYVCNGTSGTDGTDGTNALTNTVNEPAGANCDVGGVKILVGQDTNGNNILDANEITQTTYVCDGVTETPSTSLKYRIKKLTFTNSFNFNSEVIQVGGATNPKRRYASWYRRR